MDMNYRDSYSQPFGMNRLTVLEYTDVNVMEERDYYCQTGIPAVQGRPNDNGGRRVV